MRKRREARGSLVAKQKEGGRLYYPERATYLLLSPEHSPLMNIATNERKSDARDAGARLRGRTKRENEIQRCDERWEGGVGDPREQNLSENPTIGTATDPPLFDVEQSTKTPLRIHERDSTWTLMHADGIELAKRERKREQLDKHCPLIPPSRVLSHRGLLPNILLSRCSSDSVSIAILFTCARFDYR